MAGNKIFAPVVVQPSDHKALTGQVRLRVAMVSDFLEEQWPSMDLVADMLTECFQTQPTLGIDATQMRPPMRWRLTRTPLLGSKQTARNCDRVLNRFVDYPRWLRNRSKAFDIFHLVDHSYAQLVHALPPERTVVTCHDLDTFRCLLDAGQEVRPRWFRAMSRRILDGFRRAAHVIAVSQATCDELLHYGLLPRERISVASNGVHPSCSSLPDPANDAIAARLVADGSSDRIWLLSVGSTLPRKRLDVLLRVFAALNREVPEVRLVRVGGFTPPQMELIRELKIECSVLTLPFLQRPVLAAVYRRAALLLHTAESEGFGLPLVEAMACGCPVAASDIAALREVGGSAASYCPVADIAVWHQTLMSLLDERLQHPGTWELRRQQGITWARHFSWAENARQTASIYRKVMENAK
jgi:glycosyltransferase involved in cell wall biosynthesis